MNDQDLVPRCMWCIARIGEARYRILDEWQTVFSVQHFVGESDFTDGVCPECLANLREEIRSK